MSMATTMCDTFGIMQTIASKANEGVKEARGGLARAERETDAKGDERQQMEMPHVRCVISKYGRR